MARIIYPDDYAGQRALFALIKAKHTADGGSSPLTAMLAQKGINLTTDDTAGTNADTQEALRKTNIKQSENYRELRDINFDPVLRHIRAFGQYLKSYFKPNVQELGTWTFTIDNNNRINIPTQFGPQTDLFTGIKAKHDSFTTPVSPLAAYLTAHSLSLTTDATAVAAAKTNNTSMGTAKGASETATEARNNLWLPVVAHIKMIGDFLINLFNTNPKKLGDWGFVVDDSPRKPKEQTSTVQIGDQITVKGVVVGSTLTNTGTVDIHLYKGTTTTGTPVIVHAGEVTGMVKGYSTITVVNPSTTVSAKFKVLINK